MCRMLSGKSGKCCSADVLIPHVVPPACAQQREKIIAIGASTGGTEALLQVLEQMPESCPGIVAVPHMPAGFTAAFSKRLNGICRIEIKEAEEGGKGIPWHAFIAPRNPHHLLRRIGPSYFFQR